MLHTTRRAGGVGRNLAEYPEHAGLLMVCQTVVTVLGTR
jgi:hypothetical protein